MSNDQHLAAIWTVWRHQRVAELCHPYGWSTPVGQHWLREGDTELAFEGFPGLWSVNGGSLIHTPTDPHSDDALTAHGRVLTEPTAVPFGRYLASGHPEPSLLFTAGREIEGIKRRAGSGGHIYAVRMRDPRAALTPQTLPLDSFAYDTSWRIPATFTPHSPAEVIRETLAVDVVDPVQSVGSLRFIANGQEHTLIVFGHEASTGVEHFTHFRDETSGSVTHGNGRGLSLNIPDLTQASTLQAGASSVETHIDFNYAYTFPCALTPYVSCPVPISDNTLSLMVTAGEKLATT